MVCSLNSIRRVSNGKVETSAGLGPLDQDQQWLLNCLSASLDPNRDVRSFAEASLSQASLQPGFGCVLAKIAANKHLSVGLRQLAAVLLKQYVKKHWQEGENSFEYPAVSEGKKEVIRKFLLLSLDDNHRKICTALSMAVAAIAVYDWPEDWPHLLPELLKLMRNQSDMTKVQGALSCLALLSGDLDDSVVPRLVPILFPILHTIVSSPQIYKKHLRAKALSIVYSCISVLGTMSGVYETETSGLIKSMLKSWMNQFAIALGEPTSDEDPDDWSLRMEVLKCLNQFVQNFPNVIEDELLGSCCRAFMANMCFFSSSCCRAFMANMCLFEFLFDSGSAKFKKVIVKNVKELVYYTLGFLQVTAQQMHSWLMDANEFVANEDDLACSCRVSGEIHGLYQIKVTMSALALLLSSMHPELGRAAPGIIARSKAKLTPDQWSLMPLPAKILSLLAETLIEIEEQDMASDDAEDSDWEEVEDVMDRDILSATAAASSGRPGHDQLQAMARVADEEDDEDDLSGVGDPLNEIDLANYVADFLSRFSQSNKDLLDRLCQYLTPAHRSAILSAISR